MARLVDILPTAPSLLALTPEDLGMVLVQMFQARSEPRFVLTDYVMPFYTGDNLSSGSNARSLSRNSQTDPKIAAGQASEAIDWNIAAIN